MDNIKETLENRINKYKDEVVSLRNERMEIDKKIQVREELLKSCENLLMYEGVNIDEVVQEEKRKTQLENEKYKEKKIVDAAFDILKKANRPLHTKDIAKEIMKGGKNIEAAKPFQSVATCMRLDERFEKVGKNTFKIRFKTDDQKEQAPLLSSEAQKDGGVV